MPQLHCIVVTPEQTTLDQSADFVVLPLFDGEIGVAPGRSPLIGRLGFGEMRLSGADGTSRYYLDGGFVQVLGDEISVVTNRALPAGQLDSAAAARQLEEARQRPAHSPELLEIRDREVARARAQLRVAGRASSAG